MRADQAEKPSVFFVDGKGKRKADAVRNFCQKTFFSATATDALVRAESGNFALDSGLLFSPIEFYTRAKRVVSFGVGFCQILTIAYDRFLKSHFRQNSHF